MVMRQNSPAPPKPRGRPQVRPDEETLELIIEAARHEFLTSGYAATTMNAVAERAGTSTKTLYRLVPNKAELFKSVISSRIGKFMLEIDPHALDAYELKDAIEHMLISYGTLTLEKETIALVRVVIGECDRFPELAATFYETAIVQTSKAMANWLQRQCARGQLHLGDPMVAASALRGMMIMEPQRAAMLGMCEIPTAEEIATRARFCADLFLNGLAPN
jgi:AcrR family transcriptional regulator